MSLDNFRVGFAIGLILAGVAAVVGQEQEITETAFSSGMRRAQRPIGEWQGKSRRLIKTSESQHSTVPANNHVFKEISEHDASGSCRRAWESTAGGQRRTSETISIGTFVFTRKGGEKWTRQERPTKRRALYEPPFESNLEADPATYANPYEPGVDVEYKVGAGEHKNEAVLVFTRTKRSKRFNSKDGEMFNSEIVNRYWLSLQGRIVRFEQWTTDTGKGWEHKRKDTMEWEIDPTIVIKAPSEIP